MITINVQEAKTHLSHYLDEVAKGENFILCKRNKPVAEMRMTILTPDTHISRYPVQVEYNFPIAAHR